MGQQWTVLIGTCHAASGFDAFAHMGNNGRMMNTMIRPSTLAETAERIRSGEPSSMAIGEFLDTYYTDRSASRLVEQPASVHLPDLRKTQVIDAYLSAVAESLAYADHHEPPVWMWNRRYFLESPWFATDIPGLRMLLLMESPVFFRRRNLFVSRNALSRA